MEEIYGTSGIWPWSIVTKQIDTLKVSEQYPIYKSEISSINQALIVGNAHSLCPDGNLVFFISISWQNILLKLLITILTLKNKNQE